MKEFRDITNIQKYGLLLGAFGLAALLGSLWLGWTLSLILLAISTGAFLMSMRLAPAKILKLQGAQPINQYYKAGLYQLAGKLAANAG